MNLTDLVLSQQGAMQSLARENGLSDDQMRSAVEALVPAFSAGLQRQSREPAQAAALLQALGTGRHQHFLDDPSRIKTSEGNAILGHLFGRKKVSRQVAQHAAAQSGISQNLLKSLLPKLAPIILGALVKGMTGGSRRGRGGGGLGGALGQAAGGGLLGSLVESVADGFLGGARSGMPRRAPTSARRRARRQGPGQGSGQGSGMGLEDLLGGILGGGAAAPTRTRAAPRQRQRMPSPAPTPRRTRGNSARGDALIDQLLGNAPRRASPGGGGLFGQAAQPGPATDPGYQNDMGSIFERMLGR